MEFRCIDAERAETPARSVFRPPGIPGAGPPAGRSAPGRPPRWTVWLALLAAAITLSAGEGVRVGDSPPDIEQLRKLHYSEQEEVRLVQVPAVVTNRRGKLVRGMNKDDFRLFEDYVPQTIRFLWTESDQPVSIAFLLDVSGSMRQAGKLDEAKEDIRVFATQLRPEDRVGLVCFADEQVAWITDFTSDRDLFVRRLDVQEGYGQTALYDALAAAPRLVDDQGLGIKAIVLLTDGIDTASTLSTFEALGLARSVNVPIYAVGFTTFAAQVLARGTTPREHRTVEMFAEETGGRLFLVRDPDDLKEAVIGIQRELRFRYVIGYRPDRRVWDGTFRRIKLEAVENGLTVRARTGYYANP
jgi:Ca-activated chloride channel family protein